MLNAYREQYEKIIAEQRAKINELAKEKTALQSDIEGYKEKERLVYVTLERAEKMANELKEQAQAEYALEVERLKAFSVKWQDYFSDLREKYPFYPTTKIALDINDAVNSVSLDPKQVVSVVEDKLSQAPTEFNPKSKIGDYIAATGDNGFNLDEVLNPGKLKLEDLCKELGLIDEEL